MNGWFWPLAVMGEWPLGVLAVWHLLEIAKTTLDRSIDCLQPSQPG